MPTQTKENYLKAIYFLDKNRHKITLTALSKEMDVSTPTANNMVKKLQDNGWVKYEKYKPLTLTKAGEKAASLIIRKHRLTEMFLTEVMGFGWEEVHDIAEEMEHLNSEQLFDRMDEMLGFPTTDPHGSPIPNKEGKIIHNDYKSLNTKSVGDTVKLRAISESSTEFLEYLNRNNIELGIHIKIISIEPYDQSLNIEINSREKRTISNLVAEQLLVE